MNRPLESNRQRRRTRRLLALPFAFLAAASLFAAEPKKPVTLHLRNGDRITGEIVREDAARVVIRSPIAGRLTVPVAEIGRRETLESAAATATNAPAAPAVAQGPAAKPIPAPPAAPTGSGTAAAAPAKQESVLWKRTWLPGWLAPFTTNWHGNVGLGMNLGFGTTERQTFFANANAVHSWNRVANAASFNAAYGLVNNLEAANRVEGSLKTDVFIDRTRHLYAYNLAYGGYDKVRRIDRRIEEGIGLGYRILERNRFVMNIEAGGQFQDFDYTMQPDRSLWSARFSENLTWKPSDKFSLTQRLQYLPNVSDLTDYRVRADLVASYPLLKRLTVSLNVINEYESQPPFGVDNNDLQITTNVNFTF